MYAEVIVNRPTHRHPPAGSDPLRDDASRMMTFTYRLPEHLREEITLGHLVQVPLGHSTALGVIVDLTDAPPADLPDEIEIRDIAQILDPLPVVIPSQIELARWIADETLAPLSQAMRLMLPPGLEERTFVVVSKRGSVPQPGRDRSDSTDNSAGPEQSTAVDGREERLTSDEARAIGLLERRGGRIRLSTLLGQIGTEDSEAVVDALVDRGIVEAHYALVPPRPAPPRIQFVRLLADDDTIQAALPRLGHPSKQADLLLALSSRADAPLSRDELCELADCTPSSLKGLVDKGWIEITQRRTLVLALPGAESADLSRAPKQASALSALLSRGGRLTLADFQAEAGVSSAAISALVKKNLVRRVVQEPLVLLTLAPKQVLERVIELRGSEKQRRVLDALRGTTDRVWVGGLYAQTGADRATLQKLAERGLVSLHAHEYQRPGPVEPQTAPHLTPDQESAWRSIREGMANGGRRSGAFATLLHGVTGSGKTEIYMRALQATLAAGRRATILVPEISLTAQTVRRFEARFPGRVAVMHSQLSLSQRYAVWDRIRQGQVDIVIGPRSALLAPIARLGLIVVDESHDDSYKQSEPIPLPPYHARDTAVALGRLAGATVLLGSATPDVVTYYRARQGRYRLLELPQRIVPDAPSATPALPPVRIVDLRQELRAGNRSIFSRALQQALSRTLSAGQQAILFLNRRGAATFVLCRDCGYVARCPNCDVPLTLHRTVTAGRLICHRCNHRQSSPERCPACGGQRIRHFGLGTERVEAAVQELYPKARLLRWDRDTASGPDHERLLQAFVDRRADILIGTQMIAKGLDLPFVTLVGVISADTALYLPDWTAAERTFQLLTQVAGRAGRSRRGGSVIVQTYNPDHYAIRAAAHHDYGGFYTQELDYRRRLAYPPFGRLVALRFSHSDARRCRAEAERLGRWLTAEIHRLGLAADLIGPAPCFFARVQGRYRWQIVVRIADPALLLGNVALPELWRVDVDPVTLL